MIRAKAARPDAAEREIILDVVQERAVDGDAAGGGSRQHSRAIRRGRSEVVEPKRPRSSVHEGDRLVQVAIGHDR